MSQTITLNGQPHTVSDKQTIAMLLQEQGLTGQRLAVEVNQAIIPKSRHTETVLCEGDRVEIVHAIGGG